MLQTLLPRWRVVHLADGLELSSPEGRAHGTIRIRDRQAPLRSARDLATALGTGARFTDVEDAPIERVITAEGEYAAVTQLAGTRDGKRIVRCLGFVFGDDFYTQLDGTAADPDRMAVVSRAVRELTRCYSLGLGEARRRRFLHESPVGWTGCARGLVTRWIPPGFPADSTTLTVFPARPVKESVAGALDRELHEVSWAGFEKLEPHHTMAIKNRHGLSGIAVRVTGRAPGGPVRRHDLVALEDARFVYLMRLESAADSAVVRQEFHQVWQTVEPLPEVETTRRSPVGIDHWVD